jgi:hypothetical protein
MKNIPVYDIQHGVMSKSHKWYGGVLPTLPERDLPNGFLCWDDHSAKDLKIWAEPKGVSVKAIGHPWFHRFIYPVGDDTLLNESLHNVVVGSPNKPTILVSLQWGLHLHYYKNDDFNRVMSKSLEEVIKSTSSKYNWLLRLHPAQLVGDEGEYCERYLSKQFGGLTGVEWRRPSSLPLPPLLSQVDAHVTDMSSVVIEAAWFGIPSALLNPNFHSGGILEHIFAHERSVGIARVVPQDARAIETWLESVLQGAKPKSVFKMPRDEIALFIDEMMEPND